MEQNFSYTAKPNHLQWSFAGNIGASPISAQSSEFRVWFNPSVSRSGLDFRAATMAAAAALGARSKGQKIALCYSGGLRCETIAFCLHELGIPFDAYFLDIWGVNGKVLSQFQEKFEEKYKVKIQKVGLNRVEFYDQYSLRIFNEFGVEFPTYVALTYLFEKIPSDQFIVTGDGDLQRVGKVVNAMAQANAQKNHLPFTTASIFYYLWAEKYRRNGEFYFFQSTPELLASQIFHPAFHCNFPHCKTNEIFKQAFPEILQRPKSNNWSGDSYQENIWIREWFENYAKQNKFHFWSEGINTTVDLEKIFLS